MRIVAALLLALLLPVAHAGQAQVPLTVGGTTIAFPVDPGYEPVREQSPQVFAATQAALPPTSRLVELFESSADLARARAGKPLQDVFFQVQVGRELEPRPIGGDDWNALKPQLTADMSRFDIKAVIAQDAERNASMSTGAGQTKAENLGMLSEPSVYRETSLSVSSSMIVPYQMNVAGAVANRRMSVACAVLVAHNRLLNLYAFYPRDDASAPGYLRARLSATVDETLALNPSDDAVASTGALGWLRVGSPGVVAAKFGLLIVVLVVFSMFVRNLRR